MKGGKGEKKDGRTPSFDQILATVEIKTIVCNANVNCMFYFFVTYRKQVFFNVKYTTHT